MNDLKAIINTLSSDEQQRFLIYLEKKNKRKDTKNSILFKLIAKNELSSKQLCLAIYKNDNKAAYHALRKRLYQSIIDFVANTNLDEENSLDMLLIKHLLASRTFLSRKNYNVAYKLLDKAELIAEEHQLFSILNEIYHTKIQYAHTIPEININALIKKFKINQKHHFLENELNIVYTKIRTALNNIHFKDGTIDFETLLKDTLIEHNISLTDSISFKSLYQLVNLVNISAFVTNDYFKIEPFIIKSYNKLLNHKQKNKELYYHIHIVYIIANTLFRNKKFETSQNYLLIMHELMQKHRKKYYNTFILKYNLLLALNKNYSNHQNEAIHILESSLVTKHQDIETLLNIYLSLVMFYIQNEEYKKAHKLFSKFRHTDNYYERKAGKEWVIKKNLIEIILHIELQHIDLVDSRLKSFKRNYYSYLKSTNQERAITYLSFVERYYKAPEEASTLIFKNQIESSFVWLEAKREDIFVMSFYAWLKSKMEKQPLFTTTLALIKEVQAVN